MFIKSKILVTKYTHKAYFFNNYYNFPLNIIQQKWNHICLVPFKKRVQYYSNKILNMLLKSTHYKDWT
ncbi:MAG: hypothetical protein K0S93_446 [Nitrososphaeraceae archaeon]|jgi:hypothetical protein|nr:hypothetical protein [Nitrososphaeraceae archaeon]